MDRLKCPILKAKCAGDKCAWWVGALMRKEAGGEPFMAYNCAIAWIPDMLREGNRLSTNVAATVESRGDETARQVQLLASGFRTLVGMAQDRAQLKAVEVTPKALRGRSK